MVALLCEAVGLYAMSQSVALGFGLYFQHMAEALPQWMRDLMPRFDVETKTATREKPTYGLQQASQILTTQILGISQSAAQLFIGLGVMIYLLFFLLPDGVRVFARVKWAKRLCLKPRGSGQNDGPGPFQSPYVFQQRTYHSRSLNL